MLELDLEGLVTRDELHEHLRKLNERIDHMATQADVDAITTQVEAVEQHVTDAQTAIQAELDALASANPALDLSALTAAVGKLDPAVQALGTLKPDAPAAPAPAEPAAPAEPVAAEPAPADPTLPSSSPAPASGSAPAPDPSSGPTTGPTSPADPSSSPPADPAAPSAPATPSKAVYTFAGDPSQIDPGAWPASGFETAEATPQLLYYFSGDTAPGSASGNGLSGGQWVAYTGPVQAVQPPAAA